jgi:L-fuculose-phosphate aldolase
MPMTPDQSEQRQAIIDACRRMNAFGINQGTSGNISLRHQDGMPITPTSVPYEEMRPEQSVFMRLDRSFAPGQKPSSEWRFHLDIMRSRSEVNAVVHAHPPYATIRGESYTPRQVVDVLAQCLLGLGFSAAARTE